MRLTRRQFVHAGASVAVLPWMPAWRSARGLNIAGSATQGLSPVSRHGGRDEEELDLHALAARAIEAARSAGATYADARLTVTRSQSFMNAYPLREVTLYAAGVRVLVNGYWGFLSSSDLTADEMARLARDAVAQGVAHSRGTTRPLDWGPIPTVTNGNWVMPVKYDPFDVPVGEKMDFMYSAHEAAESLAADIDARSQMDFARERKVFASSEGSTWAQTTYNSSAAFTVIYPGAYHAELRAGGASADFLSPAGLGWEHVLESGLLDAIPRLVDEAEQARHLVPVDVGRYDMVFSAPAMATLLSQTIGGATELDRAMGYEANAAGTSYLGDPLTMLGTEQIGTKVLSVSGDRSAPGGAATVRWDDESVVPETFPIVRDGVLTDFQTTREQVQWLAPYYNKIGHPLKSHGCAGAESALYVTMQRIPNLIMAPDPHGGTFEDLVAGVEKGVAVLALNANMDQQQLNGVGYGTMREITKGKLGRFIQGGAITFRAPELWKHLAAIGGASAQQWTGITYGKGQPWQRTTYSVGAVPGVIKDVALIEAMRKSP